MNKKKVPNHINLKNSSKETLRNAGSLNLTTDASRNIENSYPPKMRTDYSPSDESVESATGVDFSINMPNPAVDPIVSQNISTAEFDYTQDMLSPDNYEIDENWNNIFFNYLNKLDNVGQNNNCTP